MYLLLLLVGVKLHAQVSTSHSPGTETRGSRQRADHGSRARRIQNIHLSGMRVHGGDRVSKPTCEYTL